MTDKNKDFDPQLLTQTLMECVDELFKTMCHLTFSQDPELHEKEIIEYNSCLRTFGLEKFNGPCYVAAVNFYLSPKELEGHNPLGAMILYIKEELASRLLKSMGKTFDDDDEAHVIDYCGEFCHNIADQFKNQLTSLGFKDLTISDPLKGKNNIAEGVEFCFSEHKLYQMNFHFWKQKGLTLELSMAPLPKK